MFIAMAVAFSAVALLLTVIRNGAFGRRLQAMNDSSAACATLGLDLTKLKLQVFCLAAGIAGLGGAMLAMWKSSRIGRNDFALVEGPLPGLPLVLIAVVGGITSVAGAVFGSVVFVMLPVIGVWYPSLRNLTNLAPGLAGVGLGTNPDGVVCQAQSVVEDVMETRKEDTHQDGRFVPGLAAPELLGFDSPATDEQIEALDDELGLSWGACQPSADGIRQPVTSS